MGLPPEIITPRDHRHGSKLGDIIRRLSSTSDGEVVAGVRAMQRVLKSVGADWHSLAEHLEKLDGGALTQAEMKKLYDAGYQDGVRAAENKMHGNSDFRDIDGFPAWSEIALYCQRNSRRLRLNEQEFVNDMASQTVWREPTEKQAKWLRSIFLRLGGRL